VQGVHGDVRLSNISRAPDGDTIVFDLRFAAGRPRVQDLACSLVFMVRVLHGDVPPAASAWESVPRLLDAYAASVRVNLSGAERREFMPLVVAITCYHVVIAGFSEDPIRMVSAYDGMVALGEWLFPHPSALA